ncbi:hypothetical protein HOY82DRAFT_570561, partial [Tuber indicum]
WSAWLWTTLVCLSICHSSSCVVDWRGPLRHWMQATVRWILVTEWFLRPSFIDPALRTTGGEWWDCAGTSIPNFKQYVREHDMSGHVFILTHASTLIYSMDRGCRPIGWGYVAAMGLIGLWWCILLKGLYLHPHLEEVMAWGLAVSVWIARGLLNIGRYYNTCTEEVAIWITAVSV